MDQHISPQDSKRGRLLAGACTTVGSIAILGAATPFVLSLMPSQRTKNETHNVSISIDVSDLAYGHGILTEWHAQPYIVLRRTAEQIQALNEIEHLLADPQSNKSVQPEMAKNPHRSINPEFLVASMICTHLGCSVVENPKWVAQWHKSLWVYSPPLGAHTFAVVVGVDTPQLAAGLFIQIFGKVGSIALATLPTLI